MVGTFRIILIYPFSLYLKKHQCYYIISFLSLVTKDNTSACIVASFGLLYFLRCSMSVMRSGRDGARTLWLKNCYVLKSHSIMANRVKITIYYYYWVKKLSKAMKKSYLIKYIQIYYFFPLKSKLIQLPPVSLWEPPLGNGSSTCIM